MFRQPSVAPRRSLALTASLAAMLGAAPALAADDHSQHQKHDEHAAHAGGHNMSKEDLAVLRERIPLYRLYTDEQINQGMARMADLGFYVSPAGVKDEIGILALGHGYKEPGNTQFRKAYEPIAGKHPTAAALGMAMMDSNHIQEGVDQLVRAGARTIVAIPTEVGDDTSLVHQWRYIFGLEKEGAYLDVPQVKTDARIVLTKTPTTSPIIGDILADYAKEASKDPQNEVAILVAHGPEEADDNRKLLAILEQHAAKIKQATGLREVHFDSLQDDATPDVRSANVNRMRDWITRHDKAGHRVIVLQAIMTGQGGVTERLRKDFDGLNYTLVDKGFTEHPLFGKWIEQTVQQAAASGQ